MALSCHDDEVPHQTESLKSQNAQQDLIADKIDMMDAEAKAEYGMIHLREALRNMRTARFEEAVATVRDFHGREWRRRAWLTDTISLFNNQ
jgi:hypothetical protein